MSAAQIRATAAGGPSVRTRVPASTWPKRARGPALRWTPLVAEPLPQHALFEQMRQRLDHLINANLRYIFGQ